MNPNQFEEKRHKAMLRTEAEAQLARAPAREEPNRPAAELLHELHVHQIELEMQNEELRRAQVALESSRDRYVDLYEFAPLGYLTLSDTGLITEINLTGATLLGEERKKLLNRRFALYVSPEQRDHWHQHFLHALINGEKQSCELALLRGDGSTFQARLDSQHREDGVAATLRIALTDITEHKQAEEELRIAAIAFESQSGMLVTDANAVILRVNQAFTRLTGYSAEEALGKTPHILSSGRHNQEFFQAMWTALLEKGYWQGEIWNRHKNGQIYAEWHTISAVTAPDGRTTHYVGNFFDITRDKEAADEIHRLAYYDPLTQLPNRRLLQDRLAHASTAAARNGLYGAVLFIDLDNFKTLNDARGHDIGDMLLIEVAQRLHTAVREGDTVARMGGDEFVVLLDNLDSNAEEAAKLAQQVSEKILGILAIPCKLNDYQFHCTASIGIGLYCAPQGVEELLRHADLAMNQAKITGRNTLCFFDPTMQAVVTARSAMEDDLRDALVKNQFQLYFQSQVHHDRQIISAEVLLRWQHPERGLISPLEFIPLAEQTGLILPIGQWVLESACAQLKAWESEPHTRHLQLAVNVSARQFYQADFVAQVRQALHNNAIDPKLLKLELTESLVLDNIENTIVKMNELMEIGVRFSMDDFGTGFSSLSYLTQLPLHQLKIDQSFVRNIGVKASDASIVQTIIGMAHNLGIEVIAEGVETEAQRAFLELNGCPVCQGYLFSRPVPIAEFERLLKL